MAKKYSSQDIPAHYSTKPMQLLKYLPTGEEIMDPTPMEPPIGYNRQPSLAEQMRQIYLHQRRLELDAQLSESIEEADDFDIPEDDIVIPQSPWENDRDPSIKELLKAGKEALAARVAAAKAAAPTKPVPPAPGPKEDTQKTD